jgi:hypothetical protein
VAANLSAILDELTALRAGAPTVVRVVAYLDPFVGATQTPVWWGFDPADRGAFDETFEAALGLRRHANPVNGPIWDVEALPEPAEGALVFGGDDHVHLTAVGHELVAQAIADTGFAPLE